MDYSPTQDGFYHSAAPPWNGPGEWSDGAASFFVLGTLGPSGLVFDLSPGIVFTALTLTLTEEPIGFGGGELRLYAVNAAAPALFSTANPPSISGAVLVASLVAGEAEIAPRVFVLDVDAVNAIAALPGWTGRLAFVLVFVGAAEGVSRQYVSQESVTEASRPSLSVETEALIVGWRILSYVTPPRTADLTTLATVKQEMLVSGSDDDAFLERLIDEASEDVESRLGWKISRAEVRESFAGNGDLRVRLTRRPLAALVSVTFDGVEVDLDSVSIASLDDAELVLESGWTKTERPLWVVRYWGGWLMPGDSLASAAFTAEASDNSFNDPQLQFPLLLPDEWITAGNEWSAPNRGTHLVVTRSAGKIITSSTLVDESGTESKSLLARTLPREIERACIELVKAGWHARDSDVRVKSETIDDVSTSYGDAGAGLDGRVERLLAGWARRSPSLSGGDFVRA